MQAERCCLNIATAECFGAPTFVTVGNNESTPNWQHYRGNYNDSRCSNREQSERQAAGDIKGENQINVTELCRALGRKW